MLSILRLGDTPGLGGVTGISCHPEDSGVLAVVGIKVLKFLRLHDKLLKGYGYQAGLHHTCCSLVRSVFLRTTELLLQLLQPVNHQVDIVLLYSYFYNSFIMFVRSILSSVVSCSIFKIKPTELINSIIPEVTSSATGVG